MDAQETLERAGQGQADAWQRDIGRTGAGVRAGTGAHWRAVPGEIEKGDKVFVNGYF